MQDLTPNQLQQGEFSCFSLTSFKMSVDYLWNHLVVIIYYFRWCAALSKTFSAKGKKSKLRKAWDGSVVVYNVASWGATAIGLVHVLSTCIASLPKCTLWKFIWREINCACMLLLSTTTAYCLSSMWLVILCLFLSECITTQQYLGRQLGHFGRLSVWSPSYSDSL